MAGYEILGSLSESKLIVALAGAGAGFVFNMFLEHRKAKDALRREMAPLRAKAYSDLWKLTKALSPSDAVALGDGARTQLERDLKDWHYRQGNALYLSLSAQKRLFKLRSALRTEATDKGLQSLGSALRTQLKVDCGTYTGFDSLRWSGKPAPWTKRK